MHLFADLECEAITTRNLGRNTMLVLSRKRKEAIVIDERIWVYILDHDQHRVRIAIQAPPEMNIRRDELPPLKQQPPTQENSQHAQ
jgi:carbon storage regulator CsrA